MSVATGSFSTIVDFVRQGDFKGLWKAFKLSQLDYLSMTGVFIAGVLVGVICVRYLQGILFVCAIAVTSLLLGEFFGFVKIDWVYIQSLLGASPQQMLVVAQVTITHWVNESLSLVVSAIVGFLVGLRVG